ncbi:MAG: CapA family protein [Candidatus Moraniibacteriota bacterium]
MQKIKYRWTILLSLPWIVIGLAVAVWWYQTSHHSSLLIQQSEQQSPQQSQKTIVTNQSKDGVQEKSQETLKPDTQPVTILFGGDLMFDRYIRQIAMKRGNDFIFAPDLRERMRSADAVVANLEGPITGNTSRSVGSVIGSRENYIFTFDPSWAQTLKANNITTVNIGNNHILNFGDAGLMETKKYLTDEGVNFFGDPKDGQYQTMTLNIKGIKIGLVNENQFVADGEAKALADVAALRSQVDVLVAYTHWGKEYLPATDDERRRAHALIDAGVDVVIGSHPHIVQEKEVYKNKTIYYSLGNFVFDQYEQAATRSGLLVEMRIDPTTRALSFDDIPVTLQTNGQTKL